MAQYTQTDTGSTTGASSAEGAVLTDGLGDVNKCRKCDGEMKKGIALKQNYSGQPDFIGSNDVCTVSPNGTADIIYCRKCSQCGHSVA